MILIYNDEYAKIARTKHPSIFAQPAKIAWGELWEHHLGPIGDRVLSGEGVVRWDGEFIIPNSSSV